METVEYFTGFLREIGAPNLLSVGIVVIVLWLLISGFKRGLKKRNKESKGEGEEND